MIFPSIVFILSLLGIIGLFAIKYLEGRHEKILVPSNLRQKADERAVQFKTLLLEKRAEAALLPGKLLRLSRIAIHAAALEAARFARYMEAQAHRLADFVSHKHHFEKRETRSEFLKQVREHALNSNNHVNDSGAGSGQNDSKGL